MLPPFLFNHLTTIVSSAGNNERHCILGIKSLICGDKTSLHEDNVIAEIQALSIYYLKLFYFCLCSLPGFADSTAPITLFKKNTPKILIIQLTYYHKTLMTISI